MTLSDLPWVELMLVLPLLGAGFALAVPARDRLTQRAVGVVAGLLALAAGLMALRSHNDAVIVPGLPGLSGHLRGIAIPAVLTILGVTPMALRAGAPRIDRGLPAYIIAVLAGESLSLFAVVVDDVAVGVATAIVGAVPFFALVALFGGPERGSVTWRAASLWLLVDGVTLGGLVVVGSDSGFASVVAVAVIGSGLVRLAAGPHGLWALPVLEQAPVAAACLTGGMVAPVGIVLLVRAIAIAEPAGLAAATPWLAAVLAVACAIGAALVAAERDLRRIVAHLLGTVGSVAAVLALGGEGAAAVGVVGLMGFSAALCLMMVEAVERRLETRKTTELRGLIVIAPSLALVLPASFLALCGLPGPGIAVALWPALAGLVQRGSDTGVAAFVCGASLLVASVGVATLFGSVGGQPRKRLVQLVRVSLRQGIRLLLPVTALVVASLAWSAVSAAAGAP